jgi:hypothetical protein
MDEDSEPTRVGTYSREPTIREALAEFPPQVAWAVVVEVERHPPRIGELSIVDDQYLNVKVWAVAFGPFRRGAHPNIMLRYVHYGLQARHTRNSLSAHGITFLLGDMTAVARTCTTFISVIGIEHSGYSVVYRSLLHGVTAVTLNPVK